MITETKNDIADRELVITRQFNAPRELVFHVWTQPEHVAKWWGPTGFTNTVHSMEVKPGGVWSFMMHGPDGVDYPNRIVYREVVKPEKLVFDYGSDIDDDPDQFYVTVTFTEAGNKTLVDMRMLFKSKDALDKVLKEYGAIEGNTQTMDRLEKHLEEITAGNSDKEIITSRVFNAPCDVVFKAWTDPKHLSNWWGPKGFTNTFHKFELKPDGVWEFTMHGPNGVDYPNKSIFSEITANEKIVFDHVSAHPFRVVATFLNLGSKTFVSFKMIHATATESEKVKHYVVPANEENFDRLERELNSMEKADFVIERTLQSPAEKVWKALTDKDEMKKWYFDLEEFKPETGFEFRFTGKGKDGQTEYTHICVVTEVVMERKLTYSWRYEGYGGNSSVTFELFPEGNTTKLKLTHKGLETFPADPAFARQNFVEGWTQIIGTNLPGYLQK